MLYLRSSCCFQSLDPFLKLRNGQICQSLTFLNLSVPLKFSDSRLWGLQVRLRARDSSRIRPRVAGMRPPEAGEILVFFCRGRELFPRTGSPGGGPLWPPCGCPAQQGQILGFYTTKQQKQPTPVHIFHIIFETRTFLILRSQNL